MVPTFLRCEGPGRTELWAWLTPAQERTAVTDDQWCDDRVWAYEDRDGEMVPRDVRVADLEVLERA